MSRVHNILKLYMSRVHNILKIEIDYELSKQFEIANDILQGSAHNIPFQLKQKKLENYKAISSSIHTLLGSVNLCLKTQNEIINSLKYIEYNYEITLKNIENLQNYFNEHVNTKKKLQIISDISSALTIKDVSLGECLQILNNCEILSNVFIENNVHETYKAKLKQNQFTLLSIITRKIIQALKQEHQTNNSFQIKYALSYVNQHNIEIYEKIIKIFIKQRTNLLYSQFTSTSYHISGSISILRDLETNLNYERKLIESLINKNPDDLLLIIFLKIFKLVKKRIISKEYSHTMPDLLEMIFIIKTSEISKFYQKIENNCSIQLDNCIRKTISYISAISSLNFITIPYYLKLKIIEIRYSLIIISKTNLLEEYKQTINNELISKILAYFYDINNLQNSIMSLNVYELLNFWIGDLIKDIRIRTQEIKEKIIEYEIDNIFYDSSYTVNQPVNLYSFFYKILYQRTLSDFFYRIQNKDAKDYITGQIAKEIHNRLSLLTKGISFSAISAIHLKLLLK